MKKKGETLIFFVIIGLILIVMTFFPIGKAIAKGLGIALSGESEKTFYEIVDSVKEIKPGEQKSIFAKISDDSAIIGFSSDSSQIKVIRTGVDFSFDKPAQCEGKACICLCKIMEHTTVLGSAAYYCKEPKIGEPDKYLICESNLGVEILGFISEDNFSGDADLARYGVQGGFIIAKASTGWGDILESNVFNIPKNPIIVVQKSAAQAEGVNFAAVCLNQNGCFESGSIEDQMNRMFARTMFNEAQKAYMENTEQSRQKARELFSQLIENQDYIDQLELMLSGGGGVVSHYMHDYTYILAAYNEMRDKNYDKAIEYAELAIKNAKDKDTITQAKKDIVRFNELKEEYEKQSHSDLPLIS